MDFVDNFVDGWTIVFPPPSGGIFISFLLNFLREIEWCLLFFNISFHSKVIGFLKYIEKRIYLHNVYMQFLLLSTIHHTTIPLNRNILVTYAV
jgi:hypothetical protein